MKRVVAALLALCLSGGCMLLGPNYRRPAVDLPGQFPEGGTGALTLPSDWWRLYKDPTLDRLVSLGLEKNSDLKLAVARMDEAEALVREANAALFPEIDLNTSAARSKA